LLHAHDGRIHVDLSDNPPCVDVGLNTSLGSATSAVVVAIFNALDKDIPRNAGSFRRLSFTYDENSVVGAPVFPHSCSMGTTNVSERLVNITQSAFAQLGDGHGLSEGGTGLGAGMAVISGRDARRGGAPFVNRMMLSTNGGPASPVADGWVNYAIPVIAGLMYRDSVEVDELKHPLRVRSLQLVQDSSGAGRQRGAPAQQIELEPTGNDITAVISCDGQHAPPRGVVGGLPGTPGATWLVGGNGEAERLPNVVQVTLPPPACCTTCWKAGRAARRRARCVAWSSPAPSRMRRWRWMPPRPRRCAPGGPHDHADPGPRPGSRPVRRHGGRRADRRGARAALPRPHPCRGC